MFSDILLISDSLSSRRAEAKTLMSFFASSIARFLPMPELAPVIQADFHLWGIYLNTYN
jgi:hypothetical protein